MLNPGQIARVCHEANRALQIELNDPAVPVSPPWDEAPESQRSSCIDGVHGHQAEPLTPAESHAMWLAYKEADGWVWGEVKDEAAKTHPCMVPYEELSENDRIKDLLFSSVVAALSPAPATADVIVPTDAGPDADPSQRYGWTLCRNGEALFRSTEGYANEEHRDRMARKAVSGEYRHATFTTEPS